MKIKKPIRKTALAIAIASISTLASAQDVGLFETHITPDTLLFEPVDKRGMSSKVDLIIKGPADFYLRKAFEAGTLVEINPFELVGGNLPDGNYKFETRVMGGANEPAVRGQDADLNISPKTSVTSGTFSIQNGRLVVPSAESGGSKFAEGVQSGATTQTEYNEETRDQVILDDLIVDGSACIGQDCVNGENFGFDTLRMKENNLRIKFQDTSSSASFPSNDWQLTANDSANGGANKFSIDDIDGGRTPFTLEAGAPSHSLYVDDGGRVGFGTSTPVVENHIVDGDSPTVRLEQDGSSGFTPQTWDLAGNEANFFVRDVTNGSKLPFKILPNASTDSLVIEAGGNVGIGTRNPDAKLHILDAAPRALIEATSGTAGERILLQLINNGKTRLVLTNSEAGSEWTFDNSGSTFDISRAGTGVAEFKLQEDGDAIFVGEVTANGVVLSSSRTVKSEIGPVDGDELLAKVLDLPVHSWVYTNDRESSEHIGPMAEDFHELFGIGTGQHINLIDTTGITFAAMQALAKDQARQVDALKAQLNSYEQAFTAQQREYAEMIASLEKKIDRLDKAIPADSK